MAPVGNLYRLVWGGRLFDKESWSCSLSVGGTPAVNLAASNFQAALVTWMGSAGANCSSAAKLDFIKFNLINPLTGRYVLPNTNQLLQNDLAVGPATPGAGQLTVAVSTRTANSRGRAHAGRFYPPSAAPAVYPSDGRIDGTDSAARANAARTLVNSINTVLAGAGQVVVFSKIGQVVEPVTAVRVGRVVDTMRSRRASLAEDPTLVAL